MAARMNTSVLGNVISGVIAGVIYVIIAAATGGSAAQVFGIGLIVAVATFLISFVISRVIVASRR